MVTALGVWLGPRLAERSRRQHQAKQVHLEAIKREVYQPLLNQLEHYYLPILEGKRGNIIHRVEAITSTEVPIEKHAIINKIALIKLNLADIWNEWEMSDFMRNADAKFPIERPKLQYDSQLYNDAKENHEPEFVKRWETFVQRGNEYNDKCFAYVEQVASEISSRINLPVWTEYQSKPGLGTVALAVFIWERQIGLGFDQLHKVERGERHELMIGSHVAAIGTEEEIDKCRNAVEELVTNRKTAEELRNFVQESGLLAEAQYLRNGLHDLTYSHKLKGECRYTEA